MKYHLNINELLITISILRWVVLKLNCPIQRSTDIRGNFWPFSVMTTVLCSIALRLIRTKVVVWNFERAKYYWLYKLYWSYFCMVYINKYLFKNINFLTKFDYIKRFIIYTVLSKYSEIEKNHTVVIHNTLQVTKESSDCYRVDYCRCSYGVNISFFFFLYPT